MANLTLQQAFELGLSHHQSGRLVEAEQIYRQVLAVAPQHADALHLLGVIASQVGRHDQAVEIIRQAVAVNPGVAMFHCNLGYAFRQLHRLEEAIVTFQEALRLQPDYAEAHNNLGVVLQEKNQMEEAAACFRRALQLKPDYAEAYNNLGNTFRGLGQPDQAMAAYRQALAFRPDFADAHTNLGVALEDLGWLDEAISEYRYALQIKPNSSETHYNLGNALRSRGYLDAAKAEYVISLQLKRDFGKARNNLGNVLKDEGQVEEALAEYRLSFRYAPADYQAHSNLLLALHYPSSFDPAAAFAEHRHWNDLQARPLERFAVPHANDRDPGRRLRVGYISPDFREHSVASFFEAMLAQHDRAQVEVFCYDHLRKNDVVTGRLQKLAAHWREIRRETDVQAAELIRQDRIDILVDLAGHTADNRLPIFACKPAPVQVSWLGYCDTTGMDAMDYRFTDGHADPPGVTERFHSETLVRLPATAWCFRPHPGAPPVSVPPFQQAGRITFGCFNALPKITDAMLSLWARILREIPDSRLLLKNPAFSEASVQTRVFGAFERIGVARGRVELLGRAPTTADHLAIYARVDIALDTFPYHGTATTCEALWMGVPVVTLAGQVHASRVGVSLLTNAGLTDLIANDPEQYIRLAIALAGNGARLSELRATLRERLTASPLMDGAALARAIEAGYRDMWQRWCAKK